VTSRAIRRSSAAMLNLHPIEAQAVILRDRIIDQAESDGERLGLELLVRHQPAGRNLRFIYASLRILRELERLGDCAESIARQTLTLAQLDPRPELPRFRDQASLAIEMLDRALEAFRAEDEETARAIIPMEEAADRLREQISGELLERQKAGQLSVHALTTLLTVTRRLERITDQAKHICEEVVFLATGQLSRHSHADKLRILFVDDTQAGLGHLARAQAQRHAGDDFLLFTAGLRPTAPAAATLAFLEQKGIAGQAIVSHSLGHVPAPEEYHLLIALTEGARIVFPMTSSRTLCLSWPMVEPTESKDPTDVERGLNAVWHTLEQRLSPLIAAIRKD
jgi:phosphate transport system protein